jgi:hypothetical protein
MVTHFDRIRIRRLAFFGWMLLLFTVTSPSLAYEKAESEGMSITQMRQLTSEFLQEQAEAERDKLPTAQDQVLRLCNWYVILRDDDRYFNSPLLRSTAAQVRVRLLKIAKDQARQLKYNDVPRPEAVVSQIDSQIEWFESKMTGGKLSEAEMPTNARSDRLEGAAAGPELDTGWQLVELIERIVHPDFWENQGGPGTLTYFAARRVLVVRATSDVHQELKDLLTALR